MATAKSVQASFAAGEVSPAVSARVDLAKRAVGAEGLENLFLRVTGALESKPGQRFVAATKDQSTDVRLIPFEFSADQTFLIELGNLYARFHTDGGQILDSSEQETITGATQADPVVITTAAHGYTTGQEVYIEGVAGMTELNGRNFQITVLTATTFSLQDLHGTDIDGTGYTAYSSAGTATPVYEITTPYVTADLREIRFSQNADVLSLTALGYETRELVRTANDDWTLSVVAFVPQTTAPSQLSVTVKTPALTTDSISAITQANPAVITTSGVHGLSVGDKIHIAGVVGMGELNNDLYVVTAVPSTTTLRIERFRDGSTVDSTSYGAYTSGGTITLAPLPRRYTVTAIDEDSGEESLPALSSLSVNISSVTNTDPVVVSTSEGHGLYTGDVVCIESVGGTTELNGNRFIVTRSDADSFSLRWPDGSDVDGTAFGVYSSGGVVRWTWAMAWGSGDGSDAPNEWDNQILWGSVSSATRYVIYSTPTLGGTLGYLGTSETISFRDDHIADDQSQSHPRGFNPFADYDEGGGDDPTAVAHFQQRRLFGGTTNNPTRVYLTQAGSSYNFSRATPLRDDDSIIATLASLRLDTILHILPLSDLIVMTAGAEHRVFANDGPLTPSTARSLPQSFHGSTALRPIVAGDNGLFLSRGQYVRDFAYDFTADKFLGKDLTVLSRHLFDGFTITDWDWSTSPFGLVHAVRSDGVGLVFTYQPEQEVFAWARMVTKGKYISVASIREGNYDTPYFVVRRTIGGVTSQFIERMDNRLPTRLADAFHVDAGLSYAGTDVSITGYTAADPVVITAPGHGFSDGDIVDIVDVLQVDTTKTTGEAPATVINGTGYTVANSTASTFELEIEGAGYDGSAAAAFSSGGSVRKAVTTVSGLWHLEGETVVAAANGYVERGLTVTNGAVTLSAAASRIHVGLPYNCRLKTLPLDRYADQSLRGRVANATRAVIQVEKTMGMWTGPSEDQMREYSFGAPSEYNQPLDWVTTDLAVTLKADWDREKRIVVEQRDPLPMTILAVIPDVQAGGN